MEVNVSWKTVKVSVKCTTENVRDLKDLCTPLVRHSLRVEGINSQYFFPARQAGKDRSLAQEDGLGEPRVGGTEKSSEKRMPVLALEEACTKIAMVTNYGWNTYRFN